MRSRQSPSSSSGVRSCASNHSTNCRNKPRRPRPALSLWPFASSPIHIPTYNVIPFMKTSYWFFLLAVPLSAQVDIQRNEGRISVTINGQPFTTLFCGADAAKPYLHPLRSASGKIVTRRYPMESVPGETHDHPHHRGLWFSHGNVNGFDFWSNEPSQHGGKNAKIVLKRIGKVSGGKESGAIDASFDWVDPHGKTLLAESRSMTFYAEPTRRVIDFDITLTPIEKVTFGDTKEGTFAIRLAPQLEEPNKEALPTPKRTGLMIDSEGRHGEPQ